MFTLIRKVMYEYLRERDGYSYIKCGEVRRYLVDQFTQLKYYEVILLVPYVMK